MIGRCSTRCYHDRGHAGPCADAPSTQPIRLRMTLDVTVRPDVSTGQWSTLLGQALETLRPALATGSVPMVTTTRAPENREAIRTQLRAQLDAAEDSAAERLAKAGAPAPDGATLCRCGHELAAHRQPLGAPVAECTDWGCRCGLFRAVDKVANANGGPR